VTLIVKRNLPTYLCRHFKLAIPNAFIMTFLKYVAKSDISTICVVT